MVHSSGGDASPLQWITTLRVLAIDKAAKVWTFWNLHASARTFARHLALIFAKPTVVLRAQQMTRSPSIFSSYVAIMVAIMAGGRVLFARTGTNFLDPPGQEWRESRIGSSFAFHWVRHRQF